MGASDLSDFQLLVPPGLKQILDLLVVDLKDGEVDGVGVVLTFVGDLQERQ